MTTKALQLFRGIFTEITSELKNRGFSVTVITAPTDDNTTVAGYVATKCVVEVNGVRVTFFINSEKGGTLSSVHLRSVGPSGKDKRFYQRKANLRLPFNLIADAIQRFVERKGAPIDNDQATSAAEQRATNRAASQKLVNEIMDEIPIPSGMNVSAVDNPKHVALSFYEGSLTKSQALRIMEAVIDIAAEVHNSLYKELD